MAKPAHSLADIARRVWDWAERRDFRGSDPYDGLNSRLLAPLLARSRLLRLLTIQAVKRSPIDLRPLLWIPPGRNPKGVALFLQGAAVHPAAATPGAAGELGDLLLSLASLPDGRPAFGDRRPRPGLAAALAAGEERMPPALGWGYDFPWQSKAFLQPAFMPTVVGTAFAADALAMAGSPAWPVVAPAVARFVTDHLHRHEETAGVCFSYSPGDRTRVYNASLFAARLLAQAAPLVPACAAVWRDLAARALDYVAARQRPDGAWLYGEADHWRWIDNLHTGFNLETMARTAELLGRDDWDAAIVRGLTYYRRALFLPDGTPRYYSHRIHPLDPHSFAQGAITFLRLERFDRNGPTMARRILERAVELLWDDQRGGFIFQVQRRYRQRQIHLRWSQAWMYKALCWYLAHADGGRLP